MNKLSQIFAPIQEEGKTLSLHGQKKKPLAVGIKWGSIWLWVLAQQEPCCMVHCVWGTVLFSIHSGKMCLAFTWIYKCRTASVITMNRYKGKCPGIKPSTWSSTICLTHISAPPLTVLSVDKHKRKYWVLTLWSWNEIPGAICRTLAFK